MRKLIALSLVLAVLPALTGCDSGGSTPNNENCDSGTLTANAAGQAFDSECVVLTLSSGVFSVAGITNLDGSDGATQRQIILTVPNASVGSHSIGGLTNFAMATYAEASAADLGNPNIAYSANNIRGSGQITLDELTSNSARGSFSFTAYNNAGATVQVMNGQFDVSN